MLFKDDFDMRVLFDQRDLQDLLQVLLIEILVCLYLSSFYLTQHLQGGVERSTAHQQIVHHFVDR